MAEPVRSPALPAYEPPAIVYEASLEVRAGTPLGIPDLLGDPLRPEPR